MGEKISALQQKIHDFVAESIQQRGLPPTMREIGRRLNIPSPSTVAYHLKILEAKGYLKRKGSVSRGIQLAEDPNRLPIIGRVGAGSGIIAQEDIEGYLSLDADMTRQANYLLRVRGDSMTNAGILEGDLLQVRRQDWADDGGIVVAMVEEEGVVKRLARSREGWRLESANPRYSPITQEFQVIGTVVGLIRRY
ncbi:MAG: transcriptional repressor LexA [Elusimicrobiota bacterium]